MSKIVKVGPEQLKKIINKLIIEEAAIQEGTSNFYNRNASKIYAVLPPDNGDDDDFSSDNDYIYENAIDNVVTTLSKVPGFYKYKNDEYEDDYNRNFEGIKRCEITKSKVFPKDGEISVTIICITRSGYYEGLNFDWDLKYTDGTGYDIDDVSSLKSATGRKWAESMANKLVKLVEMAYAEYTTKLSVSARFSNGETIYAKENIELHEAHTPWGMSDSEYKLLPGFTWFGTPSHGGLRVSAGVAVKKLSPQAIDIGMFSGGYYWYEEDVAYTAPFYELPELRSAADNIMGGKTDVAHLERALREYYPKYFEPSTGSATVKRTEEYKNLIPGDIVSIYDKEYKINRMVKNWFEIEKVETGGLYKMTKNLYIKSGKLISKRENN